MGIDISTMPVRHGQMPARRLRLPESECGVVEQQSNEGTKLSGFVALFLGCSKDFKMK
jgi:hypothetical protein